MAIPYTPPEPEPAEIKISKSDSVFIFALLVGGLVAVAVLMYLAGVRSEQTRWRAKAVDCSCGEYRLNRETGEIRWTWRDWSAYDEETE